MQQNQRNILLYSKKFSKSLKKNSNKSPDNAPNFTFRVDLLTSAYNCWSSMAQWRRNIRRNEEFVYGDQWSDRVYDAKKCRTITERQMLVEQGLQPSQYNIIRNIIRTILGVWSTNKSLPSCIAQKSENQKESEILTATLHSLYRKNETNKLDYSEFNQLIITGLSVTKNHFALRDGGGDVVSDYVNPFNFFIDNMMTDPRYRDCTMVGSFYDLPVNDIAGMFSQGSASRAERIKSLYASADKERLVQIVETFTDSRIENDFYVPELKSEGLGRVIEVWQKEGATCYWVHDYLSGEYYPDFVRSEKELHAENVRRIKEQGAMGVLPNDMLLLEWKYGNDQFWRYYYLTPLGEVLDSGINPFWHEKPPYIFEIHEFFVGKIYPFVKDLIDANKQINKLSAISELLTKYSAKSLMLMPLDQIADAQGYGIEEIEKRLTEYDAVLPYNPQKGSTHKPEFLNTIAQAFTPLNVVNMYLKLSEQVSGVYGALQGQQPTSGTPAQMYAQQSQNSATSLNGLFESINSYRLRRDKMLVQLMQQFYNEKRYIFDKTSGKELLYDPDRVKNIDVEISVVEGTNTPAYRLMVNEVLMQLKQYDQQNMIDLRGLIEMGNWPFKDKLLDYLNGREQEAKKAGQMLQGGGSLPPELAQEMGQYQFAPEVLEDFGKLPTNVQRAVKEVAP